MHYSPLEILQKNWGYDKFRPLQEDIINHILAGHDTLALLPTGGGKSLCFQVPALYKAGVCLVISPLIALMRDQVDNLRKRGIPAAAVFSGMPAREIDIIFENACNGGYRLLYLSPERLKTDLARTRIERMDISLLAIDEAHCISQWGYDFRPPYLEIAEIRRILPHVPCLALTATATEEVVADIQKRLSFGKTGRVFQQSFQRKNLSYSVLYELDKRKKLLDIFNRVAGTGIVYARNRRETKEISEFLQQNGLSADFYHAGLTADERTRKQENWTAGKTRIIACTNAFGMGIDKPDVRAVVHLDLPESLEAYFQEAGRGGRDGQKSYAALLYHPDDAQRMRYNFERSFPEIHEIRRVYQALGSFTQTAVGGGEGQSFDFDISVFAEVYKLDKLLTLNCLSLLEKEGWISISDSVFKPATMRVLIDRTALYDYQLKHKDYDKIVQTLFRAYEGLQHNYQEVSEAFIAKHLNIPIEKVSQVFIKLKEDGVIDYNPQKDKPQLTYLRERIAYQNLTIDPEAFNFRKKRTQFRLEAAIRYAERLDCRSQQLLAYFGETESDRCGVCDVCTGRNKTELATDEFENFEKKFIQLLENQPLAIDELLASFSMKQQPTARKALSFLIDEGKICWRDDEKLEAKK